MPGARAVLLDLGTIVFTVLIVFYRTGNKVNLSLPGMVEIHLREEKKDNGGE
jgi:hypothetical protein